ncbi:unnamed protein product [Acanthoscelides obtectus]|uniref:Uncharacterized protein n=1 Tax=Acanthoscelides obtectus TaxID=200917 RepID=A0A9P0KG72_ACAOB|nr:unnamed protein product [Acanthoscelides obtectus]CAK1635555.1 hypothetical protein AOBTE_LOCUS9351 [Acanthoscelides obtectus]
MKSIIVLIFVAITVVGLVNAECIVDECVKSCQQKEYSSGQCTNRYGLDRCVCIGGHHNNDCETYCHEIGRQGGTEWYGKCICA